MIRVNELRIGNIIQDTRHPERQCTVFRLTSGIDFNITYQYDKSRELSYSKENSDALQSIPLTEDWLLKFGFSQVFITDPQEPDAESKYWIGDFELFEVLNQFVFYCFDMNRDCIYKALTISSVHQLQNLYFAIYGKELTIKSQK